MSEYNKYYELITESGDRIVIVSTVEQPNLTQIEYLDIFISDVEARDE